KAGGPAPRASGCRCATAAAMALAQLPQLWALLDEMAENEPRAYRRLLRQQRDQAARFCAPPEPRLCLRTRPAGIATAPLFINVCGWKRVPAPRAPGEPIPVSAGPLEEASGEGDLYSVIDVAYNPDVLQRGEENPARMEHLVHLTLKFVEQRCSLLLSDSYTIESFKLKGSLETTWQRLRGRQTPAPAPSQSTEKELTLEQLLQSVEGESCSNAPVLLEEESRAQGNTHLIEEISSTEQPERPQTPAYEMITVRDVNEEPLKIELRIKLPKVSSVSECDLRVSKDDIVIEVPEKYRLQLELPEVVDEEKTTAAFNTGSRVLVITAPVPRPET
ncbi:LOW QUALITY PROTEIN: PIH1 domain-containing protein 2, partial [Aegotheles albertisi]